MTTQYLFYTTRELPQKTGKRFAMPLASAAFLSERQANKKVLMVKKEKRKSEGPQKVA